MKSLSEILEIIKADVEANIPDVLNAEGLSDFEKYIIGPTRDSELLTCGIMFDPAMSIDITSRTYPVLYFLQLVQTEYSDALLYADIFNDYILNFDSYKLRATLLDGVQVDIIPMERERVTLIYITATFSEPEDSCD